MNDIDGGGRPHELADSNSQELHGSDETGLRGHRPMIRRSVLGRPWLTWTTEDHAVGVFVASTITVGRSAIPVGEVWNDDSGHIGEDRSENLQSRCYDDVLILS